jgi:lysophospholipase L1-like esterase
MKKIITCIVFGLSLISFSFADSNIVIIGDSHSAGPFGRYLVKNLSELEAINVALYGHASSAPLHWMRTQTSKLSGGVQHLLNFDGKNYRNPNPTDWRERVAVPNFNGILSELAYHNSWQRKIGHQSVDVAVIALGANDYRAVSTSEGKKSNGYTKRLQYITQMIDELERRNIQCLWVGPPDGIKKTSKRQKVLYQFLKEAINNRCAFFNSNHFKATDCDGVHFSCRKGHDKAKKWAREVSEFIKKNL